MPVAGVGIPLLFKWLRSCRGRKDCRMPRIAGWRRKTVHYDSVDQSGLREVTNNARHVGADLLDVRAGRGLAGDGVGDELRRVPAIAIGEDQRRGKGKQPADALGVVQGEAAAAGLEAEVGAGSGIAATARILLHITKLSLSTKIATSDGVEISTCFLLAWKTSHFRPSVPGAMTALHTQPELLPP